MVMAVGSPANAIGEEHLVLIAARASALDVRVKEVTTNGGRLGAYGYGGEGLSIVEEGELVLELVLIDEVHLIGLT